MEPTEVFPAEIWANIFNNFSPSELRVVKLTCREINYIASTIMKRKIIEEQRNTIQPQFPEAVWKRINDLLPRDLEAVIHEKSQCTLKISYEKDNKESMVLISVVGLGYIEFGYTNKKLNTIMNSDLFFSKLADEAYRPIVQLFPRLSIGEIT